MKFSPEKLPDLAIEKIAPLVEAEKIIDLNPENKKSETPILVAPGWGQMVSPVKEHMLKVLAEEGGRRVLATDYPREMKIETENLPEGLPLQELQKAATLLEVLDKKIAKPEGEESEDQEQKVDLLCHSEGGLYGLLAACLKPERFRNIVLANPAGLIGKDSLLNLAYRFIIKEGAKSTLPKTAEKGEMAKAFWNYAVKHPKMSLGEARQVSESDTYDILKYLKKRGIKIAVVATTNDDVFTMERIQKHYSEEKAAGRVKDYLEIIDGFYSTLGTHGEAIGHGEDLKEDQMPRAIVRIFEALEKK